MQFVICAAGLLLVGAVVFDVLKTTMAKGSGFMVDRLGHVLWRILVKNRPSPGTQGWVFMQGGLLVMILSIGLWILLLWAGWTVFFLGAGDAVVNSQTNAPATVVDRIYFSGYTLFTLGLGDFKPEGDVWKLATSLASLTGLFIVTFSITFIIPVLQAAVERRKLALYISTLGTSAEEILIQNWEPETGCEVLEQHLVALAPEIALLAQRHLSYPVLHYFHGSSREEALAPSLAALDEALTLVEHGAGDGCISQSAWRPVRMAIAEVLRSLDRRFISASEDVPPPVRFERIREAGIPCPSDTECRRALELEETRRRLLLALVAGEGWTWDHVRLDRRRKGDLSISGI